jgi:TfoX/Sxy family transcriptional regulator of competence genes
MADTVESRFAALVDHFEGREGVTHAADGDGQRRRGFGSSALMVGGKIFAMVAGGRLVVKVSRTRVDELVDAGEGERFDPRKNGRVMREWLVLDPDSELDWTPLAEEAVAHVGGA